MNIHIKYPVYLFHHAHDWATKVNIYNTYFMKSPNAFTKLPQVYLLLAYIVQVLGSFPTTQTYIGKQIGIHKNRHLCVWLWL